VRRRRGQKPKLISRRYPLWPSTMVHFMVV
jgi:hypothetical protein